MLVAYCAECLPAKVVLGYSDRISELRTPHGDHPQTKRIGYFSVGLPDWRKILVEGDEAQTKANIVTQLASKFEA